MIERKGGHIMARYRIRIECLDGSQEMSEEYRAGIECEGFTLIAKTKDATSLGIEHMSVDSISDALRKQDQLMAAAILADAKERINQRARNSKAFEAIINGLDI